MRAGAFALLVASTLAMPNLLAQPQPATRAEEIQAARRARLPSLQPDEPSRPERILRDIKDKKILERFTAGIAGFRLKLGGLATGSGFALGPEYLRRDLAGGRVLFRGSARASTRKFQLFDLELSLPQLARRRAFLDLYAVHRNYPRIDYYGPGPDSRKTGRSAFRLEDTAYDATAGLRPLRYLTLGGSLGYLQINVGPGADKRFVSSDRIFPPALAPGIDRQSDFLRGGFFAQLDWRDHPGGPRRGGNYLLRHNWYSDRTLGLHSFRRLDLEAQQYLSFFNERRVIALRAKSALTFPGRGQNVPFYLQPTLGGSEDLRGFRPFRFYDDNVLVLNAEYRWETFSGLDAALFFDAGKVFPRRSQLNLHDLEASAGFGLRFNVNNSVFLRVDVGFSHEGFQAWLKFNNVF
ncbi:MAG TPA: BamA/TamA family outer membrane protein [Bryobacteraceae bacterium]|nr:BamA/TamA family outer membrane protein [Bryobacteraceae bacterium]